MRGSGGQYDNTYINIYMNGMGLRTSPHLRDTLSLRMNSYKSPEKHNPNSSVPGDHSEYLYNTPATSNVPDQYNETVVQPVLAGLPATVLESFLSEARTRHVKSSKTLSHTFPAKLLFYMSGNEMREMEQLVKAAEKIVVSANTFIVTYRRRGLTRAMAEPDVRKWPSAQKLTRLSYRVCERTVKLEDLVKHSNSYMLKAIHKFFHGLIEDEVVRRYYKTYDILPKAREFMREFVREGDPGKQREALLKKLKEPDFVLPKLFALYDVMSSRSINISDIKHVLVNTT